MFMEKLKYFVYPIGKKNLVVHCSDLFVVIFSRELEIDGTCLIPLTSFIFYDQDYLSISNQENHFKKNSHICIGLYDARYFDMLNLRMRNIFMSHAHMEER